MRKRFLFFALFSIGVILDLSSINSYAIFLIELKNGRRIFTENYLVEGDNIILYLKSGSVKIPKEGVQSILEEKGEIKEEEKKETTEEKIDISENLDGKKSAKDLSVEKKEIDIYVKQKAAIQEKLEEAKKVYFNLTEKSEKERARDTMISISKELFSLEEEVMKKNNGILPEWWEKN
jgi:hypothetical protein